MRRLATLLLTGTLAASTLVACGGGKGATTKTFAAADLARIVLQTAEAPSGTQFQQEGSGVQSLDQLAEDDAERTRLTELGFRAGHLAVFASAGLFEVSDPSQVPANARFVASLAMAFSNTDNARKALEFLRTDDSADAKDVKEVDAKGLGERSFGLSFSALDAETPFPGFLVGWQRGNAIFAILAAGLPGSVALPETLGFARTMDGRAA